MKQHLHLGTDKRKALQWLQYVLQIKCITPWLQKFGVGEKLVDSYGNFAANSVMADPSAGWGALSQWPRHFNKTESSAEVCRTPGTLGSSGPLTCPCQILTSPGEDRSDRRQQGSTGEQRNDGTPQHVPERKWEFFWRPELHVAWTRAKIWATELLTPCWEGER